jgi:hypothetical protein
MFPLRFRRRRETDPTPYGVVGWGAGARDAEADLVGTTGAIETLRPDRRRRGHARLPHRLELGDGHQAWVAPYHVTVRSRLAAAGIKLAAVPRYRGRQLVCPSIVRAGSCCGNFITPAGP